MRNILVFIVLFVMLFSGCNGQLEKNKIDKLNIPLPENWINNSSIDLKENLFQYDLSEDEIIEVLKTAKGGTPVAVFMKYDPAEFSGGPIPTIQVNLMPNSSSDFDGFREIIVNGAEKMKGYFTNFEVITPIQEVEIDGIKGFMFISQFDMANEINEKWTIRSWLYAFPSGEYFYQINFSDTEDEDSKDVYDDLVKRIKFTN